MIKSRPLYISRKVRFLYLFTIFTATIINTVQLYSIDNFLNLKETTFSLVTVGLGETVDARFGHTIIRVTNEKKGYETNINWGMFYFEDPNLPLNFFQGRLNYWVGEEPSYYVIMRYKNYEKRPVWLNQINFTDEERLHFYTILKKNLNSENKFFLYQYFFNNCSTIPRDHINHVLGDELKFFFQDKYSSLKFRNYVLSHLNSHPAITFLLDIFMNSRIDRKLSLWDEMFYPPKFQEHLITYSNYLAENTGRNQPPLIGPTQVLVDLNDAPSKSWTVHPWFLLIGIFFSIISFCQTKIRIPLIRKIAIFFAITYQLILTLFIVICSLTMILSWGFSDHLDLHANANLNLFWITDVLFLGSVFLRKNWGNSKSRFARLIMNYALLRIAYSFGFLFFYLAGFVEQNCHLVLTYIFPVLLLFYLQQNLSCKIARIN